MSATAERAATPAAAARRGPDAVVDLQTDAGAALVGGWWRAAPAELRPVDFASVGADLGPSGPPARTYDLHPHAEPPDFDDSGWDRLAPADTMRRLGAGRVSFHWYRIDVTLPDRVGHVDPTGATVVFEIVVDDYAEVWVDGRLPLALGDAGGPVVAGFNAPNRVVLTRDARPGDRFTIAVLGINGPISASPANYVWIRSATLDLYRPGPAPAGEPLAVKGDLDAVLGPEQAAERVAAGLGPTEGPAWTPDGALLVSSPAGNVIHRITSDGVTVFRTKSGYAGVDIGRSERPGSSGLAFDPAGRLTICQGGHRRVLRVEPRGNTTVLAGGLDRPRDLAYRSDGTLYVTDAASGVVRVSPAGAVTRERDDVARAAGVALSPDEGWLYVGSRDGVVRHAVAADGSLGPGDAFADTGAAVDGLAVDAGGRIWACGAGGISVLSPDGAHVGTLVLPEAPHDLAFGGDDGSDLYVTDTAGVLRIRTVTAGAARRQKGGTR